MELNPIGIAVPFFVLLILIEMGIAKLKKRRIFRLNDSIADMSCGLGEQLIGIFIHAPILAGYAWFQSEFGQRHFALDDPMTWVVGMFGVDFMYYWYHRFSHRVHFGWATHVVHHQSEEYNLAVALRQPWFTAFYSWLFYVPLAILGIPVEVYATCFAFNLIYQFWIHTELIKSMGAFGWFFNTPAHHRGHHAINPRYIDKNYAGILIIWDRMFGTFVKETEKPLYGTLKPFRSWNPAWANVEPWVFLWRKCKSMPTTWDKIQIWFRGPEWEPANTPSVEKPFPPENRGYDVDTKRSYYNYILLQYLPVSVATMMLLTFVNQIPIWVHGIGAFLLIWTMVSWSSFFEQKRWAMGFEFARLSIVASLGISLTRMLDDWTTGVAFVGFALISALYLIRCMQEAEKENVKT
jgi:sterol desaturase/sphingolipid hydroxylase (fatty acid hydroxylase superfamily)